MTKVHGIVTCVVASHHIAPHLNDERGRGIDDEAFVGSQASARPQAVHGRVPEEGELEVRRDPVLTGDGGQVGQDKRRLVVVVEIV